MKMKIRSLFLIIALTSSLDMRSQDCFQDFLQRGVDAYGLFQFQQAIDLFNAAKICPEINDDQIQEIDDWISKANNGYINEITKARDEALILQKEAVKQARFSEANRLAYLAAQELEKRNLDDALLLAYSGLEMIAEDPLDQVRQIFGNVVASTNAKRYNAHTAEVLDCGFLQGGRLWSRASDQSLILWNPGGTADTIISEDGNRITCARASTDGGTIAFGFENGNLEIREADGNYLTFQAGTGDPITDLTFSESESLLATSYRKGGVKIWNLQGELIGKTTAQESPMRDLQFSQDAKLIIGRSASPKILLFEITGALSGTISHSRHIYQARLSPDQQKILTCSADSSARISSIKGETLTSLPHPSKVHKTLFSPDGQGVLTAALDGNIRFWDLSGKLLWTVDSDEATIESIQFSPDGQNFLSFGKGNQVKLWSSKGQLIANLDRHSGSILSADISPDSKYILTTGSDDTAKLWNVNGQLIMNADQYGGPVSKGKFSANSQRILTACADGELTVLQNPDEVFESLKHDPVKATEDQKVRFGLNSAQ
jgi:WD40 repeat protein